MPTDSICSWSIRKNSDGQSSGIILCRHNHFILGSYGRGLWSALYCYFLSLLAADAIRPWSVRKSSGCQSSFIISYPSSQQMSSLLGT